MSNPIETEPKTASRTSAPEPPSPHAPPRVVIFGAGITGLTVAHELIERGFDVQVVESKPGFDREYEVEVGGVAANQRGVVKASLEVLHPHLYRDLGFRYLEQVRQGVILDEDVHASALSDQARIDECRELEALRALPLQSSARSARLVQRLTFEHRDVAETRDELRLLDLYLTQPAPPQDVTDYLHAFLSQADCHGIKNVDKLKTLGMRIARTIVVRAERLASDIGLAERFTGKDLRGKLSKTSVRREIFLVEIVGHASPEVANDFSEELSRRRASFIRKLLVDRKVISRILELPENEAALDAALDTIAGTTGGGHAGPFIRNHRLHLVARGSGARTPLGRDYHERRESNRVEFEVVEVRLPGDHGYRFFPAFYRHLFDTMRRTPILLDGEETGETAFDRLVEPRPVALKLRAKQDCHDDEHAEREVRIPRRHETLEQLRRSLQFLLQELGLSSGDLQWFMFRLTAFLTSGKRRRLQYEKFSWIEFLDGLEEGQDHVPDRRSRNLSKRGEAVVRATLRSLLAMDGEEIDAHSYGVNSLQLLLDPRDDHMAGADMTLNGPTSDVWLRPWKQYLAQQGVQFFSGQLIGLEKSRDGELRPLAVWREHPDLEPSVARPHIQAEQAFVQLAESSRFIGTDLAPMPEQPGHVYCGWVAGSLAQYNRKPPDFYVLALPFEAASALAFRAEKAMPGVLDGDWKRLVEFDRKHIPRNANGLDTVQFDDADPVHGTRRVANTGKPDFPLGSGGHGEKRPASSYPLRDFSGIQYFFDNNTRFGKGHIIYPESPWGLTAISQIRHWRDRKSRREGYLGQYSVDLGDFYQVHPKLSVGCWFLDSASETTRRHLAVPRTGWRSDRWEIPVRTWDQVLETIDPMLARAMAAPRYYHLDEAIVFAHPVAAMPGESAHDTVLPRFMPASNLTPFLINLPGQFAERPGQRRGTDRRHGGHEPIVIRPEVSNGRWLLAGTYMATHTRIMTMEASNESGRHAVVSILHAIMTEKSADPTRPKYNSEGRLLGEIPEIFDPYDFEVEDLRPLKELDDALFEEGLPHVFEILGLERLLEISNRRRPEAAVFDRLRKLNRRDWGFLDTGAVTPSLALTPMEWLELVFGKRSTHSGTDPTRRGGLADGLDGLLRSLHGTPTAEALQLILDLFRGERS